MEVTRNSLHKSHPGRGGFTLIEVLMVVLILAVLAAIVFGMNITAGEQRQALAASRMLCSDLEFAQSHAIAHRVKVYGTYSTQEDGYEYRNEDGDLIELPEGGAFQVRFSDLAGTDLAKLESVWIADGQPFHFDETGTPSSDARFTVSCGKYTLVVEVVSATGRVLVRGEP